MSKALSALQVIAVRYRRSRLAHGDERSIDAFAASSVYQQAQLPFDLAEPVFPEAWRVEQEAENIGLLCGIIAEEITIARRAGKAILMTGGDCTHSTGILGGLQGAHGPEARIGLVWLDAHGDFNTPKTTLTGSLGGMPVAVCAGLAWPRWREGAHIAAPLPTERIVLVDVRNLDPPEEQLIRATNVTIAAVAADFPGQNLQKAVADLAEQCDMIYLHIDSDVLDESFVPNHGTKEPKGPNMEQVLAAIDIVMATGKVVVFAVVSVYGEGEGSEVSVASGIELIRNGLASWRRYGMPSVSFQSHCL